MIGEVDFGLLTGSSGVVSGSVRRGGGMMGGTFCTLGASLEKLSMNTTIEQLRAVVQGPSPYDSIFRGT